MLKKKNNCKFFILSYFSISLHGALGHQTGFNHNYFRRDVRCFHSSQEGQPNKAQDESESELWHHSNCSPTSDGGRVIHLGLIEFLIYILPHVDYLIDAFHDDKNFPQKHTHTHTHTHLHSDGIFVD